MGQLLKKKDEVVGKPQSRLKTPSDEKKQQNRGIPSFTIQSKTTKSCSLKQNNMKKK